MKNIISWILRIVAAVILLQTLFFKFTAAPESVELFTRLGMEPYGRIGTGIVELIASVLLLVPRTTIYGAILGIGLMVGAIGSHFTKLGWEGPMLSLGLMAIVVLGCCIGVLALKLAEKKQ
ncbi:MAG: DoxX family protein [Puniceicoccaceae bacterium]